MVGYVRKVPISDSCAAANNDFILPLQRRRFSDSAFAAQAGEPLLLHGSDWRSEVPNYARLRPWTSALLRYASEAMIRGNVAQGIYT
jgi:hypothetical protein